MSHRKPRRSIEKETPRVAGFIPAPPYSIDVESLCLSDSLGRRPAVNVIKAAEWLLDKIGQPDFHLEYVCRGCEDFRPAKSSRPKRRGAVDPVESCFGCHYGHLNGIQADFASTDRDAAFSAWANARAKVMELEIERSKTTSAARKESLTKRLDKAHKRVASAAKRCKRLGFAPTSPRQGVDEWVAPLASETRDDNRRRRERNELRLIREEQQREERGKNPAPSPSCKNCRNWSENKSLSGPKGTFGDCWVLDYATKASFSCVDHNPMPRASLISPQ